jgi:NAD(P)H-hydrate epimerase
MASQIDDPLPRLPPRRPDSHKGDFGRALLVGGSRGMTGAIGLAGMAALRGGAGLVKLAVPDECLPIVAAYEPCYMSVPLPADGTGRIAGAANSTLEKLASEATAMAIGPGLGQSDELCELVVGLYESLTVPLVVDADGLNALAKQRDALSRSERRQNAARILTPHPGEFARLAGIASLQTDQREAQARALAAGWGAIVVLKGHRTVITDGERLAINATGNPGMSTGGAGDVLTGVITALLCQGLTAWDAARLGVYVHGLAGDLAAAEKGQVGLIARDLVDFLPQALAQV